MYISAEASMASGRVEARPPVPPNPPFPFKSGEGLPSPYPHVGKTPHSLFFVLEVFGSRGSVFFQARLRLCRKNFTFWI